MYRGGTQDDREDPAGPKQALDYLESAENLCRQVLFRIRVLGRRYGSHEDVTLERCHSVQEVGQVGHQLHWSF